MVVNKGNIFNQINTICFHKTKWEDLAEDKKTIGDNMFIINRFLSMEPEYIDFINYMQQHSIPKENLYKSYLQILPKKKFNRRYINKEKNIYSDTILKILASYYECSTKQAKEYISLLGWEEIKQILTKLGYDEKEIKKLK